jgi:hypothetical protein
MPDTLFIEETMLWIRYNGEGFDVQKEFQSGDYYKRMEETVKNPQRAAVIRIPGESVSNMTCVPLNWVDFSSKVLKSQMPSVGMIQQFIQFHSDRPTVTRIFVRNSTIE